MYVVLDIEYERWISDILTENCNAKNNKNHLNFLISAFVHQLLMKNETKPTASHVEWHFWF